MAPDWTEATIPDLHGVTAAVTGANRGIGLEIVRGMTSKGAHVVLAVRRPESGEAAAESIRAKFPDALLEVTRLDLADLASVRRFAETVGSRFTSLDLLINNAGAGPESPPRTVDGFERAFGTNHLGHFALVGLLLPRMLASSRGRVVTISSFAHGMGRLDFDSLDGSKHLSAMAAYAQSKLANTLFAYELQRRLSAAGADLISVACHPGVAATPSLLGSPDTPRGIVSGLMHALLRRFAPTAAHGAQPALYAATASEVRGGDYIGPGGWLGVWGGPGRVRSSRRTRDETLARQLWDVSERMTGVTYAFGAPDRSEVPVP
ncbi:MAG TPA: oxidoreductase [Candidatus Binatia bacterium]|nr:oxidoreductase [Candidatus Binatia bacterium]